MSIRLITLLLILLLSALLLTLLLVMINQWITVYEQFTELNLALQVLISLVLLIAVSGLGFLVWRLMRRSPSAPREAVTDLNSFRTDLEQQQQRGVDTRAVERELDALSVGQKHPWLHVTLFGQASTGKSSLINALLPDAQVNTDVRVGSTQDVTRYQWTHAQDTRIELTDMPGFDADATVADEAAVRDEALRSHLVLYLCDSDLNRVQATELTALGRYRKPMVVIINKADQYSTADLTRLTDHINTLLPASAAEVVAISAGNRESVLRIDSKGNEQRTVETREVSVTPLLEAIARLTGDSDDQARLKAQQEHSVLIIAASRLRDAETRFSELASERSIKTYSRRAMIAAMASVAPGTDLIIQGALATRFMTELADIHGVAIREVEIKSFLKLAGSKVRNNTAIVLALAGNAMKSFPGIGTIAGGLTHAIAYGIIFEALGRSASRTMAEMNRLNAKQAAHHLEDQLNAHLQSRAGHFAALAIEQFRQRRRF